MRSRFWKRFQIFAVAVAMVWMGLGADAQSPTPLTDAAQANREGLESFRFVQLCDPQLGMGGFEHDVRTFELAVRQINQLQPDFVVICGDLINDTTDDQAFATFNRIKEGFSMPCYCVAGNHDIGNKPTISLLERYRKIIGKDYYSFEHKGYTFIVVNTQLWKSPVAGEMERQDEWLKATLDCAAKARRPIFIAGHYPLFLQNPEEEEAYFNLPVEIRQKLVRWYEDSGVEAVLTGHCHKNIVNELRNIQYVTTATTSRNFDGAPMGFRLWHIGEQKPYRHEYIPVEDSQPPGIK